MKKFLAIIGSALMGLVLATGVYAAENVVAQVKFADPIVILEVTAMQFGVLDVNLASGETIVLAPDDGVTGTGIARIFGIAPLAADLTITASAPVGINIHVATVSTGTGYGLGTWTCEYDLQAETACDGSGWNVTSVANGALRVGVTLTGDGAALAGDQNGTFDVTVTYQ